MLKVTKTPLREGFNIGATGFEPMTPTTPKWYATKLRYAPFLQIHIITLFSGFNKRFENKRVKNLQAFTRLFNNYGYIFNLAGQIKLFFLY